MIDRAKQRIEGVSGRALTMDQRKQYAIELAQLILQESRRIQTRREHSQLAQLARMMDDIPGKAFTTCMTDQCFRSQASWRVADQLNFLIKKFGIPIYLTAFRRFQLRLFKMFSRVLAPLLVPLVKRLVRQETSTVILPGEPAALAKHMKQRQRAGVRVNLNHLGEAILGETEAENRLWTYLNDLARPEVEVISVKISTIYSQINLVGWEETLARLSDRLRRLYRAAIHAPFRRRDGTPAAKLVNLDMEEYRDLQLTIALFCRVLDEPEFRHYQAGIVLQAYLPEASAMQQQLTEWAMRRVAAGGAPIKIRIVKGANLAMEQVDAALHGWPQAPYPTKEEVDANFKRMVMYGCQPEHAKAAHLGIASHNLFDIAFALLLRTECQVESAVCFEMLEGMADPMRRVVQALSGDMLLYCPAATQNEFQNAVAYLIRRLDENTAPQNFLRHIFHLEPNSIEWDRQVALFSRACEQISSVATEPRRKQNRLRPPERLSMTEPFTNEADTDWALAANRLWVKDLVKRWRTHTIPLIPLVIDGQEVLNGSQGKVINPSAPKETLYTVTLASHAQVDRALDAAKAAEVDWAKVSVAERTRLLADLAQMLRRYRGDLIGAMVIACGKTAFEADVEVSEAIDFAEYYWRNCRDLQHLSDIHWSPKGTVVVAPPWNFPASIPAGGIIAALVTGNSVIFKPAREAVLIGWILAQLCWEAGIPKRVLQFLVCDDEPVGSALVRDTRVNAVILTGATATARHLLKLRPGLDLLAETGGKNSMIVTAMADRDLAVRDLIQSAFGHAGQKCSACSLAILEEEVIDDPHFREQLRDAAASLRVGPSWDLATRVTPLIHPPGEALERALTTLDPGEEWLLMPKVDDSNPHLWSPGIKLGVRPGSFMHRTELFGPVLGVMRADSLAQAIEWANDVPYGLTAGIHSLDSREIEYWLQHIEAGNCYVNRGITGAIVQRQPFGGCKDSSFGRGAKAGGPNYLIQLMHSQQSALPMHVDELSPAVVAFDKQMRQQHQFTTEQGALWQRSLGSYAFYWNAHFSQRHDPSLVLGQDNFFCYRPQGLTLRLQRTDRALDLLRVCAAALTCGTPLEISGEGAALQELLGSYRHDDLTLIEESEEQLIERLRQRPISRVRLLSPPTQTLQTALGEMGARVLHAPVLANGRLELLNYLREIAQSIDMHRYGNLGMREGERRAPLVGTPTEACPMPCTGCSCERSVYLGIEDDDTLQSVP